MLRLQWCVVACLWVMACNGLSAAEPRGTSATDLVALGKVSREAEAKLLANLHKTVKAEWSETPLKEVLKALADAADANLWIDEEAISSEGISTDEWLVDLHLGEVTVWQAFRFVLQPSQLDWVPRDGVLAITSAVAANEMMITRTYDVKALVEGLEPQLKKLPQRHRALSGGGSSNGGFCGGGGAGGGFFQIAVQSESLTASNFVLPQFGGGGGLGGGFGSSGTGIPINAPATKIGVEQLLAELITECADRPRGRTVWESVDGEGGTISIGQGRLIVRQLHQVHFQIRELLQVLEEFVLRGSKANAYLVARPGYPHEEDAAILKRLAQRHSFAVKDAPLDEALTELAQKCGLRIWIDKEALSSEGVSSDQPVTLTLVGRSLDAVLSKLLEPLSLTAVVDEGTLVITTKVAADEMQSTKICFTGDIPEARQGSELLTTIQEATSGKWQDIDGEGGVLLQNIGPEWLAVRQTSACQREIALLLDDLRRPVAPPAEAALPELELRLYPVADESAIDGLIASLPQLIPDWETKRGMIVRLGHSLAIKQTERVHEQLDGVFSAINQAHTILNPPKTAPPEPKVEPKPAAPAVRAPATSPATPPGTPPAKANMPAGTTP